VSDIKPYKLLLLPNATFRLDAHVEFLARVSETAADKLRETFYSDIRSIPENPESHPIYTSKTKPPISPLRWKLIEKRYRIVYGIQDGTVIVFDIQDCRQDTDKNLV
jgi:mRNA-degrading endonuclease RelE of RelBE toxin-antitoxin system